MPCLNNLYLHFSIYSGLRKHWEKNLLYAFLKNRLIESLGVLLILVSFFLLASIATYSPSDPNFIYSPENTEIKNLLGIKGSLISDIFFQSLGLISILFSISLFFTGINIIKLKKI